jgi:hypothetical protein
VTQQHPVVDRYLTRFEASINEFDFPEREEITQEIRNHIAEAQAAGTALDSVLQTLGPADVLARAYAVELALHPHAKRRGTRPGAVPKAIVARGMRGVRTQAPDSPRRCRLGRRQGGRRQVPAGSRRRGHAARLGARQIRERSRRRGHAPHLGDR